VNPPGKPIAHDAVTGRDLYVLELPSADAVHLSVPVTRFGCFLVMNATSEGDAVIRVLARRLLAAGAVYFATWGPDCQRVHDLIDAERPTNEPGEHDVIMTTWHERVDLDRGDLGIRLGGHAGRAVRREVRCGRSGRGRQPRRSISDSAYNKWRAGLVLGYHAAAAEPPSR